MVQCEEHREIYDAVAAGDTDLAASKVLELGPGREHRARGGLVDHRPGGGHPQQTSV